MYTSTPVNKKNIILGKPMLRIPDMVNQKFAATHADAIKKLEETISQETQIQSVIRRLESNASAAAGGSRTMASPQWDNDPPVNWQRTLSLAGVSVADFDSSNTHHPFAFGTFFGGNLDYISFGKLFIIL